MTHENPLYRQDRITFFPRRRYDALTPDQVRELAEEVVRLVDAERAAQAKPVDRISTGYQQTSSPFLVPWNGDPDTNPLADWLGAVLATGVPVRVEVGEFLDGSTWTFDVDRELVGVRNVTVKQASRKVHVAPVDADPCPNGECDHPAELHDVQPDGDPRPMCCAETDPTAGTFCPCGTLTRDAVWQFAEYYLTGAGRLNWAEATRCEHLVRFVMPCADCGPVAPLTHDLVRQYPAYFISGPGRERASTTQCRHRSYLTDSCPGCDQDDELDELIGARPASDWLPEVIADLLDARDRASDPTTVRVSDVLAYLPPKHQAAAAREFEDQWWARRMPFPPIPEHVCSPGGCGCCPGCGDGCGDCDGIVPCSPGGKACVLPRHLDGPCVPPLDVRIPEHIRTLPAVDLDPGIGDRSARYVVDERNRSLFAAADAGFAPAVAATEFKVYPCPNGTCEHPAFVHDVETLEDPLPRCADRMTEGKQCPCGTLTRAQVEAHPDYYVLGDGYDYASDKRCAHDVQFTEPCTKCDAETLTAKKVQP